MSATPVRGPPTTWTPMAAHSESWLLLGMELPEQGGGSPDASEQSQALTTWESTFPVLQVETKAQGRGQTDSVRGEVKTQDFSSPCHEL